MSIEEISLILLNAERPIDVFGGSSLSDIKKQYKELTRLTHPDIAPKDKKDLAERTQALLNEMYEKAIKELEDGIYNLTSKKDIYKTKKPLFEFDIKSKHFKIYEQTDVKDVYIVFEGLDSDDNEVLLYLTADENDNELCKSEYKLLSSLDHLGIEKPINKIKINNQEGFITLKPIGLRVDEILEKYSSIEDKHIAWILERMLSLIGYLHSNNIVHGNIKPENVYIDVDNHNVKIVDYSLAISEANKRDSKYKIVNEDYTPMCVSSTSRVLPKTDIYSVGMIALTLLGGDIKTKGMPVNSNRELRVFIRKMLSGKENDAWGLWDELIKLRHNEFERKNFEKLVLRKKGR